MTSRPSPPPHSLCLGPWTATRADGIHAYLTDGFVSDAMGEPMVLSFNQARAHLAGLNQGWQAGGGTETALCAAIDSGGDDFEGKLVLPPAELLENTIHEAVKAGRLPAIAAALRQAQQTRQPYRLWAYSSTQHPQSRLLVRMFHLGQGVTGKTYMDYAVASVLPVRLYRQRRP